MKILRGLKERPVFPGGTVVAIGNFDGLHLGHQKILRTLVRKARMMGLRSVVLTFSPHPETVLEGSRIGMIQTLEQRLAGIRAAGPDAVVMAAFNRAFAGLTPEEFAADIIASSLRAKAVVVGENFRFGRSREGDVNALRRFGRALGFLVDPVPPAVRNGRVVSSSLIRELLGEGRIEAANALLGRPYEITGQVVRGAGRGRELGIPTANVRTSNEILPEGVFITAAEIRDSTYAAVTNIGRRPTFGPGRLQVEAHLFGFHGRLYGRRLVLRFFRKVRGEKQFSSPERLVRQVREDFETASAFFQRKRMGLAAFSKKTGG